ncbi:FtsX-like permease family protein [Sphaerimonospora cavernae]|uniref:FtsX-like permease family protein n=1 Tax=Sphaerimonospora cavernae TaxID=1740611 RepID=A0ABV6TX31_9ACTN
MPMMPMMPVLALNNVRTNRVGFAASFAAVLLAVVLVASSGVLVTSVDGDDELNGVMSLLVLSAVVSGFVSVFVVAGTMSLHVLGQRRTWGLLRSVGMTPRQVRRLIVAEALVVAVLAGVAGCVLAVPYAGGVAALLTGVGLAPAGVPLEVTWGPFILALAVGLVVTLTAARIAARKAVKVTPLEVLREEAAQARTLPWSRMGVGAVALAAGVVLLCFTPRVPPTAALPAGFGATMALCVAASALGPVALRGMGWLLGGAAVWLDPGPGELARASVVTQPRRAMSMASPVMLTVAFACTFLFAIATSDEAAGVTRTGVSAWAAPVVVGSAMAYTVISVLNSTAMSMAERAREMRLLRSAGATPAQLTRAVCWESLIVTCAGALLGTGIAAASLTALGLAASGEARFVYSAPQHAGLVGVCAVSGLIGGLLFTRTARHGPLVF